MEKLVDLLEKIAAKIGTTSQYLWPRVTGYLATEAALYVVLIPSGVVVGAMLLSKGIRSINHAAEDRAKETELILPIVLVVGGSTLLLIATIGLFAVWPTHVATLLNPEGAAVLRALK